MMNEENHTQTLLLVEDHTDQRKMYYDLFQEKGWKVIGAQNAEDALHKYKIEHNAKRRVNAIVIDMGLPPSVDDPMGGVRLAQAFRKLDPDVPMMTYTGMSFESEEMAEIVSKLVPIRVSFVAARRITNLGWGNVLNLVANQYFILDAQSALALTDAMAVEPDPFVDDKYWECLYLLEQGKPYRLIANDMGITEDGVRKWMQTIRDTLVNKKLVLPGPERGDILRWYQENYARYRHIDKLRKRDKARRSKNRR